MPEELSDLWQPCVRLESFPTQGRPVILAEFAYHGPTRDAILRVAAAFPRSGLTGRAHRSRESHAKSKPDRRLGLEMRLAESEERHRLVIEDENRINYFLFSGSMER